MDTRILVTLGPSSLNRETVKKIASHPVHLFRINLSHTPLEAVAPTIEEIRRWSEVPICLDSEGAQVRNRSMNGHPVRFLQGETVRIHFEPVQGDANNLSLTPQSVAADLVAGDRLRIDFDAACIRVVERRSDHCRAVVEHGGRVGSHKAVDLDRRIALPAVTDKDRAAIGVAREMGVRHFALSFANTPADVEQMRAVIGPEAVLISKIESAEGVLNLEGILDRSDEILIDRGDLSRQVRIEKIPFLQRRIIAMARAHGVPVHVATNLVVGYLDCPVAVCARRDPKGLYRKAARGEIDTLIGFNTPYLPPADPDIVLDTAALGVAASLERLDRRVRPRLYPHGRRPVSEPVAWTGMGRNMAAGCRPGPVSGGPGRMSQS